MLKKYVAFLLFTAVISFSLMPSGILAQSQFQAKKTNIEQSFNEEQSKPNPNLRKSFAKDLEKYKNNNVTGTEFDRMEKERFKPVSKGSSSKSNRTFLIVFFIGLAVLVTALIIAPYKGPKDCNEPRPQDQASCDILFGNQ